MFNKIIKYTKLLKLIKAEKKSVDGKEKNNDWQQYILDKRIETNLSNLKNVLGKSVDTIFREFKIGVKKQTKAFICFIDGLGDKKLIDEFIFKPLMFDINVIDNDDKPPFTKDILTGIKDNILYAVEIEETKIFAKALDAITSGNTALFIDGYDTVLIISAKGGKTRAVTEPETEITVRGNREGFVETIRDNTAMLRRRINNPNLVFELFRIGKKTHTDINICYINGIVNEKIVEEVRKRLKRIDIDSILASGYIEQLIEDNPLSLFATVGNSEKPDKIAAKLLEGRVAILVDGASFVLTVPHLFIENFQATEDYFSRPYYASFLRLLRFLAFFITLLIPSIYVAVETFNHEIIPSILFITMAAAREGIPFPAFVETAIMILIFEILRESGIRLPRQVGQAVSIVGALVVGESAVRAGIISAPMVIIGSITGITSYINPSLADSIFFFRFFFIILSASFGMYGIITGLLLMLGHMCSLRSFGTPYLAPLAPTIWKDLKDSIIRSPLWLLKTRPKSITRKNSKRQNFLSMPNKPDKAGGKGE